MGQPEAGRGHRVAQIDVDAFGVDLGLGVPVAALQVQKTSDRCCRAYRIYSLRKPSRLLRKIKGGISLARRIPTSTGASKSGPVTPARWTISSTCHRAADFAPTMVLRFERGRLLDVARSFKATMAEKSRRCGPA